MGNHTKIVDLDIPGGSLVIAPLSSEANEAIDEFQAGLSTEFGADRLWLPAERHITVAHLVRPDTNESIESVEKRNKLAQDYGKVALEQAVARYGRDEQSYIPLTFDNLDSSEPAVILRASDTEQADKFRGMLKEAMGSEDEPEIVIPNIVHATIARFRDKIPIDEIEDFSAEKRKDLDPVKSDVDTLQLVSGGRIYVEGSRVVSQVKIG